MGNRWICLTPKPIPKKSEVFKPHFSPLPPAPGHPGHPLFPRLGHVGVPHLGLTPRILPSILGLLLLAGCQAGALVPKVEAFICSQCTGFSW